MDIPPACPVCNNLAKIDGPQSYGPIEPSALKERALSGKCVFCPLLLEAVQAIEDVAEETVMVIDLANRLGVSASDGTLFLKVRYGSGKREVFELYSIEDYSQLSFMKPFQKIKHLRDIPGDTSSIASLSWVKERISECNISHAECFYDTQSILPKRVLDLGDPVLSDSERLGKGVKLVETNGARAAYFCLSHCWGASLPLSTTQSSLDSHLKNIAWSTLPRTYQDAITFTRNMGVRYLWIDSVCIIQDSPSDWRTQSSLMGLIYKSSSLVLAAAMSTSAHHGCFSQSPSYKWSADLPLAIQNQPITFRIRRQVPHESYMSYHTSTTQAPLFHRAWIFQERILAPRVLFFMTGELIFKCCHHTLCECASEWLVHDRNWLYDAALQDPAEWSKHWHDWVHLYSRLALTYESDKLPAISGLANEVCKLTKGGLGTYLAGLWRETLAVDLLWYVQDHSRLPPPAQKRIPSWSWMAVNSQVSFKKSNPLVKQTAITIDAQTTHATDDPFGQISSASLTLSGFLSPVSLRYFNEGATPDTDEVDWRIYHNFAVGDAETGFMGVAMDMSWDVKEGWRSVGEDLWEFGQEVYAFEVGESPITCFELILRGVRGREGVFERIGLLAKQVGGVREGRQRREIFIV